MASPVTAGTIKDCTTRPTGGVSRAWAAPVDDVDTFTYGTNGEITGITMKTGKVFFLLQSETGFTPFQEPSDEEGKVYTQQLDVTLHGRNAVLSRTITNYVCDRCGFIIIHREYAGGTYAWGIKEGEEAYASNPTAETGGALTDTSTEVLRFTAQATVKAIEVDATVVIPVV